MKHLLKWLTAPVYRKYRGLYDRITTLETVVGELLAEPPLKRPPDSGFNGQENRKAVFKEIISRISFDTVLETGTWIGNSTGFMAEATRLPVHTCEINDLYQAVAKKRLSDLHNISYYRCDSRQFLKEMSLRTYIETPFIYLDAHWYADLPLAEELEIIAKRWKDFVILVDDFSVPGDHGYGYDDYGYGKALELKCFDKPISKADLAIFFPTTSSNQETGARRGWVILCPKGRVSSILESTTGLEKYKAN
jgi:predicted O-methyltransferase YrrM